MICLTELGGKILYWVKMFILAFGVVIAGAVTMIILLDILLIDVKYLGWALVLFILGKVVHFFIEIGVIGKEILGMIKGVILILSVLIIGILITILVLTYFTGIISDMLLYDLGHLFWALLQIGFVIGVYYFIDKVFTFKSK